MAQTTGFVQRLKWSPGLTSMYAYVGPEPTNTSAFVVTSSGGATDPTISGKRSAMRLLQHALLRGYQVTVAHPDGGSEVTSVSNPMCDTTTLPLQLDAIEVTQAIQNLSHSVPLIAGKRTVVRAYLSYYAAGGVTVGGQLSIRRSPSDPPTTVASSNSATVDPAQNGNLAAKRNDTARSLNFVLPASHTAEGPLAIKLASVTNAAGGASIPFGCERRPTVRFIWSPPLRVRIVGIRYQMGTPPVTYAPSNFDFQMLLSWLARVYPAGQIISSQTTVDTTTAPPFGCGNVNAQLAAIRTQDMAAGGDNRTHYYGLVSDSGFWMRGCSSGVPSGAPDSTTVASGPTGPGTWGWDNDGSYGDWYGGHELAHTYGRMHPGYCGESQDDLAGYPYANGQLAGTDNSFVGFDVGDPALNLPMTALPGTTWRDVMTYCNNQWISAYTYRGLRTRLIAEGG